MEFKYLHNLKIIYTLSFLIYNLFDFFVPSLTGSSYLFFKIKFKVMFKVHYMLKDIIVKNNKIYDF